MIDGPNLYAYVVNDPINYIDPMGTTISIGNDPGIWEDDTTIPDPVGDIFDVPSGSPKMDEVAMSDPGPINSGQSGGDCLSKEINKNKYSSMRNRNNASTGKYSSKKSKYSSQDDAAKAAISEVNPISISKNREYGGMICETKDGNYYYTKPKKGKKTYVDPGGPSKCRKGSSATAYYHTHAAYDPKYDNENFSSGIKQLFFCKFGFRSPAGNRLKFSYQDIVYL